MPVRSRCTPSLFVRKPALYPGSKSLASVTDLPGSTRNGAISSAIRFACSSIRGARSSATHSLWSLVAVYPVRFDRFAGVSRDGQRPGRRVAAQSPTGGPSRLVVPRRWLAKDIVAGIVLTTLLVPHGMAYAELAGLPPITGLYTSILCLLGYAAAGPSRILVLGPDSSLGPMIAATILPLIAANGDAKRAI